MRKFIIGIDLGGTNTKIGLVAGNNIVSNRILNTKEYPSKNKLIDAIVETIKDIIKSHCLHKSNIKAIGMGVPGLVDYSRGFVYYLPNISGWRNTPLKKIMQKKTGLPIFIDNDVNALALAELHLGAGKNVKNFVVLTLGTGVGGGIVADGRLYRGANFCAGEAGHIPINESGPKCNCGGRGCLERYIGNKYILQQAKHIINKSDITLEDLGRLAKNGNKRALAVWQKVGRRLGVALSGIVNFFNPQKIIIGGGIANVGSVLFDEIRRTIHKRAMPVPRQAVSVVKSRLGKNSGILGCAYLVEN